MGRGLVPEMPLTARDRSRLILVQVSLAISASLESLPKTGESAGPEPDTASGQELISVDDFLQ